MVVLLMLLVTMINPEEIADASFTDSHLYKKIRRMLIVVREVGDSYSDPSFIRGVYEVDIDSYPEIRDQVEADYEEVRSCVKDRRRGFSSLTGKMGCYMQPRTKGTGHGSTSRAFYARKKFMEDLGLLPEDDSA